MICAYRFMHDLLPNVEWTNDNITVFGNIIERLVKLFKKIQAETSVSNRCHEDVKIRSLLLHV